MCLRQHGSGLGRQQQQEKPCALNPAPASLTALQGYSTDEAIVSAIAKAAEGAKTVLVLLDSDHSYDNVARELDTYCARFVTVGS